MHTTVHKAVRGERRAAAEGQRQAELPHTRSFRWVGREHLEYTGAGPRGEPGAADGCVAGCGLRRIWVQTKLKYAEVLKRKADWPAGAGPHSMDCPPKRWP